MEHSASIASVPATAPPHQKVRGQPRDDLGLGASAVFAQAKHDLFGTKDVQDAITASYVWLADQQGHIALGLIPTLLACWAISDFVGHLWQTILYVAAAVLIFAYWTKKEWDDYHETLARAQGSVFLFDKTDIRWNMKTALFFFTFGGAAVAAGFVGRWYLMLVVALLAWPALRITYWWLRRKLAFQQAGLPYLYRLANFHGDLDPEEVRAISTFANMKERTQRFWHVVFGRDVVAQTIPTVRHLLICGPLSKGKTCLAVGIGCEFAFALGRCRYLSAQELLELMAKSDTAGSDVEYNDGRLLWPWQKCDLLIMDDLDVGVATRKDGVLKTASLIHPEEYENALKQFAGRDPQLGWLGERRSVWVVDDPQMKDAWQTTIARLLGVPNTDVMVIDLEKTDADVNTNGQPTGVAA
jgi:hypothetical protein